MIPLFFYKRFTIDSPLSQEEAVERLSAVVAPTQWFSVWVDQRQELFEGFVSRDEFQINRIIQYRNSFLPILYGRFYPRETGLQIRIVMTLHPIVLIIAVNIGLSAGLFILASLHQFVSTGNFDDSLKKSVAIIAFFYGVFSLAFGLEAVKASRLLTRLFEAKQASDAIT